VPFFPTLFLPLPTFIAGVHKELASSPAACSETSFPFRCEQPYTVNVAPKQRMATPPCSVLVLLCFCRTEYSLGWTLILTELMSHYFFALTGQSFFFFFYLTHGSQCPLFFYVCFGLTPSVPPNSLGSWNVNKHTGRDPECSLCPLFPCAHHFVRCVPPLLVFKETVSFFPLTSLPALMVTLSPATLEGAPRSSLSPSQI